MHQNKPLVSIGMPVYNSEKFIRQSLDSLLEQNYDHFELIISDNASTDSTVEICREYEAKDKRIRFYHSEQNRGAAWNFQRVYELSHGEYFMWAGSHDLWDPTYISACANLLYANPEVLLVYPRTRLIDQDDQTIIDQTPDNIDTRNFFRFERVKTIISKLDWCNMAYGLFRSSALSACRLGIICCGPDHVLLLEVSLLGSIAQIPDTLFIRREERYHSEVNLAIDKITEQQLLRINPHLPGHMLLWPHWIMGWQHILGVLHARIPLMQKVFLCPFMAIWFCRRWRALLIKELIGYKRIR